MAFGEVATAGNVEDFRGFYTCDGLTNQPMKFYVCDLYNHGFNELEIFKKAYDIGFLNIQLNLITSLHLSLNKLKSISSS